MPIRFPGSTNFRQARTGPFPQVDEQKHLVQCAIAAIAGPAVQHLFKRQTHDARIAKTESRGLLEHQHRSTPRVIGMNQTIDQCLA